ncbi:MAG: phosphatidylserine decarboxylase [Lachnospiraceae bacterium]
MKYIDRKGKITIEESKQDQLLEWLYGHALGRAVLKLLVQPILSKIGGWFLNTKLSLCFVKPFVKSNGIDLSVCKKQSFDSYNDFFKRKLKVRQRPVCQNENIVVSPCDGKLSVYDIGENCQFRIKHTVYTVQSLLHSKKLAESFQGGMACVFRLTVDDYHRYIYIDDGVKTKNHKIEGILHTVNPIANDFYPIYKENAREFCLLNSAHFGKILVMEVGALMVGKICNDHEDCVVKKGVEKGHFEFGGSTIVVLFQKNQVLLDADILENTKQGYEIIVKMGEGIGKKRCGTEKR